MDSRSRWTAKVGGYLVALAVTAGMVLLRWLLDPLLGDVMPLVTLYGAVATVLWYGGYRSALVAMILGYLACNYLFIQRRGNFAIGEVHDYLRLVLYLFTCFIIIGFGEALRLAQRRRVEGRELLRVTFASIGDAVLTTDTEGRISYLNAVAESLTGWTYKDAVGQPLDAVFCIVNEHTRQPVENPVKKVLAEGRIVELANHSILIAKDGAERPIDDSAAPIRDAEGALRGVVLIFRDISERRKAEADRRQLAAIVQSSDNAILSKDPDGIITSWNQGAERLYGYTAEEVIGKPVSILHPPEQPDALPGIMERLRRGEQIDRFETVRVRKGGQQIEVSISISPITNEAGRFLGASTFAEDFTERRRAEQLLRQSEAQFRQLADAMPQIVWMALPDGSIYYFNERWYEYFGFARGASEQLRAEDILHPEDAQRCRDTYFGCVKSEQPFQMEYRFKDRRTGGYRWFLARAEPVRDEQGKVVRWFGTSTDIDDIKKAEEVFREADRCKDEFLAMLAHELRNPLAPLRTALEILRQAVGNAVLIEEARSIMERQVGQLVRLVDDLLDISRITRSKLQLRKEQVELADVIRTEIETARPLIKASAHELTVTIPSQSIPVQADQSRLIQVFANLLNNAAKYTEKGGHIRMTVEQWDGEAVVTVRDTGIGIAAEQLSELFKMFSQAAPALERSQGGLGIGLSLVKGLVELHGGTIEARSDGPGKGSEFAVRLPINDDFRQLFQTGAGV